MKIRCICLNDSNRPKVIPVNKWVVKDKEYHITHIFYHPEQGISGCELAEIYLDESCTPYESFALNRFGIPQEELEKFMQMLKNCTELNDIEIGHLIEESCLETV